MQHACEDNYFSRSYDAYQQVLPPYHTTFVFETGFTHLLPGRVAQLVAHLTQESEVPGAHLLSFLLLLIQERTGKVNALVVHVVNHLGGLSLPRNSVVRLTDHPDMTIAVYHGR